MINWYCSKNDVMWSFASFFVITLDLQKPYVLWRKQSEMWT